MFKIYKAHNGGEKSGSFSHIRSTPRLYKNAHNPIVSGVERAGVQHCRTLRKKKWIGPNDSHLHESASSRRRMKDSKPTLHMRILYSGPAQEPSYPLFDGGNGHLLFSDSPTLR